MAAAAIAVGVAVAGPAWAQVPRCAPDMTRPGSFCVDRYEASVWRIPATNLAGKSNKGLITKVQKGKATAADLTAGDATQLGVGSDNYSPCTDNGQTGCGDIYAVSIAGVLPSANITWFQAQQACANSQKRLPRSGEWQQAVSGTPDPGPDNGMTDCNTVSALSAAVSTGSRSACVSRFGNFDMVGNLLEWVEDWVPRSTGECPGWGGFSDDFMCIAGASTTFPGPGVLMRGGNFGTGSGAGPLYVSGAEVPTTAHFAIGFRCAR